MLVFTGCQCKYPRRGEVRCGCNPFVCAAHLQQLSECLASHYGVLPMQGAVSSRTGQLRLLLESLLSCSFIAHEANIHPPSPTPFPMPNLGAEKKTGNERCWHSPLGIQSCTKAIAPEIIYTDYLMSSDNSLLHKGNSSKA